MVTSSTVTCIRYYSTTQWAWTRMTSLFRWICGRVTIKRCTTLKAQMPNCLRFARTGLRAFFQNRVLWASYFNQKSGVDPTHPGDEWVSITIKTQIRIIFLQIGKVMLTLGIQRSRSGNDLPLWESLPQLWRLQKLLRKFNCPFRKAFDLGRRYETLNDWWLMRNGGYRWYQFRRTLRKKCNRGNAIQFPAMGKILWKRQL